MKEIPVYATISGSLWVIHFKLQTTDYGWGQGELDGRGGLHELKLRLLDYGYPDIPIYDLSKITSLQYVNFLPKEVYRYSDTSLDEFFKILEKCGGRRVQ